MNNGKRPASEEEEGDRGEPPCKRLCSQEDADAVTECAICNLPDVEEDDRVWCRRKACKKMVCRGCALEAEAEKYKKCYFCQKGAPWRVFTCTGDVLADWLLEMVACPECGEWCVRGVLLSHLKRNCAEGPVAAVPAGLGGSAPSRFG